MVRAAVAGRGGVVRIITGWRRPMKALARTGAASRRRTGGGCAGFAAPHRTAGRGKINNSSTTSRDKDSNGISP
jgi:hypothetical protein